MALTATLLGACSGTSMFASHVTPGVDLQEYDTFYVVDEPDGKRFVRDLIVDHLKEKGLTVETGDLEDVPADTEIVVRFADRWIWDPTEYLHRLNVQFIEHDSGFLLAMGESLRTTIAQRPAHELVAEAIGAIYADLDTAAGDGALEIPVEDLVVRLDYPLGQPLPITVSVIGFGEYWLADDVLTGGVRTSMVDNGVFASTVEDDTGDYTLMVVLTEFDNGIWQKGLSLSTHWQLYRTADRTLVWQSEIEGSSTQLWRGWIPESPQSIYSSYFKRSMHKIIEEGMTQLSELELGSAGT